MAFCWLATTVVPFNRECVVKPGELPNLYDQGIRLSCRLSLGTAPSSTAHMSGAHEVADQQQATESYRLRSEAARLRRVAEGLNSKADRETIARLAEETDRAAYAAERSKTARGAGHRTDAIGLADI